MVQIILVMHAPLGEAFASCAQHILGAPPALTVLDVQPDAVPDACVAQLTQTMRAHDGGTLILCDIYGATPFNIASRAVKQATGQGLTAHLITGTNLCMVLKALTEQRDNPDALSEKVRLGALKGIVNADCAS